MNASHKANLPVKWARRIKRHIAQISKELEWLESQPQQAVDAIVECQKRLAYFTRHPVLTGEWRA